MGLEAREREGGVMGWEAKGGFFSMAAAKSKESGSESEFFSRRVFFF